MSIYFVRQEFNNDEASNSALQDEPLGNMLEILTFSGTAINNSGALK
ncbi:hypothetical protein [Myxosarcina sp. GI1(2024)]